MSDDEHLYDIDIKTLASPAEVATFCDLLEANGYAVVTDLEYGKLRIFPGGGDSQ